MAKICIYRVAIRDSRIFIKFAICGKLNFVIKDLNSK